MGSHLKIAFAVSLALISRSALAVPTPVEPIPTHDQAWRELGIRVDVRNLVGDQERGKLPEKDMAELVAKANRFWSQCAVRFVPRSIGNVSVLPLNIPYEPASEADLSKIAGALNPNGFTSAIPLTLAGPWNFGLYGLGWAFIKGPGQVDRIGAMIGAQRIREEWAGQLVAHELGHALSLAHDPRSDNVMAGGAMLAREQCMQARSFAESALVGFIEKSEKTLAVRN